MATKTEVLEAIAANAAQLAKAKAEIVGKIADLEAQIGAGAGMDEVLVALESIKAAAQGLDDVVPDAPTP